MSLPSPFARQSAIDAIDRQKNRSGRHAARLRRDWITAHASYRFNTLTTRPDAESAIKVAIKEFNITNRETAGVMTRHTTAERR